MTRHDNRICVSGMAATAWSLPGELAMYGRTGTDAAGLAAAKVAALGWRTAADEIARAGVGIEYLVHAFTADPRDEPGWARQVERLTVAVDFAARLGAPTVYLTVGPSGDLTWEEAADRFVGRMAPVVERAGAAGVALALENTLPVRCDLSFAHSVRDAAELARRLDVGLCVDLYCCWQEGGLPETLRAEMDRIRLVQVSDFRVGTLTFPNRWVPGDADLPMADLLADVLAAGYRGTVDIELTGPAIEEEGAESALTRAVAWTAARLGR
ncbi:sugar phosphate isomerase/epimerase family protein [Lentzea albidocapillata]|uniref:Sugar phosphate isomerase/epimerase n=1 Tax=Lentzea albidocapillata TaxID=40571 RepID=A0A1W2DFA4_9PSEU|nr:TIM barrel protein [Lentzea albidocapillata]SMC95944.1 Sugar phosphate isomerase/epimerase [Lentzea albidocapillata]